MEICFLRHAEAQDSEGGVVMADSPLTSLGASTVSNVVRSLSKLVDDFDLILTSPLLRARQTADIAGNVFNAKDKITLSENLLNDASPLELINELKRYRDLKRFLLIGHQPHLGKCISFLTGESEDALSIKKGGCALVRADTLKKGACELVWIKEPADFK